MRLVDAQPGMTVKYTPYHAKNDPNAKDVAYGIVSSVNDQYVFVKFSLFVKYGVACEAEDLEAI